jgi:hypothetical protein
VGCGVAHQLRAADHDHAPAEVAHRVDVVRLVGDHHPVAGIGQQRRSLMGPDDQGVAVEQVVDGVNCR